MRDAKINELYHALSFQNSPLAIIDLVLMQKYYDCLLDHLKRSNLERNNGIQFKRQEYYLLLTKFLEHFLS